MKILLYGVSHQTTPIEIRERYTIEEADVPHHLSKIKEFTGVEEAVILTTCNRTEYYLYIDQTEFMHGEMLRYIGEHTGFDVSDVISTSYGKFNSDVATHLFSVATGLDSLMVGETQILSQVKGALKIAQDAHTAGPILSSLFNKAVSFSKKAHTETLLDQLSFNPSTAAVKFFKEEWTTIEEKRFLLVGAGKMIRLAAKSLIQHGATHITILNRHDDKAEVLADELNEWVQSMKHPHQLKRYFYSGNYANLAMALASTDGVIVATKSSEYIIHSLVIQQMQQIRRGKKELTLVDLAVPRNVDPEIQLVEGIHVYDMDQIGTKIDDFKIEREKIIKNIHFQLDEAVLRFNSWYQERRAVPYMYQLRTKTIELRERTMKSLHQKLPDLNERELRMIDKHFQSVMNQLSKAPIQSMKELAKTNPNIDANDGLESFVRSLGLLKEEEKIVVPVEGVKIMESEGDL